MATQPRLLYISPVIPALTGNGLAMRAGTVLEALADRHEVHLLVFPLYASVTPQIPEPLEKLCCRSTLVSPRWRQVSGRRTAPVWKETRFDVVHLFRLATLRFAEPYLRGFFRRPQRHLDLDDIESVTRRRLAALYRQNGHTGLAEREEAEALRAKEHEDAALRRFDRVYVCSASDAAQLAGRTRARLGVLPNAVRPPQTVPPRARRAVFTFFFVGTLGYYPNEDAVRWLCSEIVPRMRESAGSEFVVNIAGTGASESLRQAANVPNVSFVGAVPDLSPWYAQADAVLAPVRAGGGTRIKILEAFSFARPVVATSIAIEGIDARAEEHVVLGDSPAEFAQQCVRLMSDAELCARLGRNARALVDQSYSIPSLQRALEQIG